MYNEGDKVLMRYKRGHKLARVVVDHPQGPAMLCVWNATKRCWGSWVVSRSHEDIYGRANANDLRAFRFEEVICTSTSSSAGC